MGKEGPSHGNSWCELAGAPNPCTQLLALEICELPGVVVVLTPTAFELAYTYFMRKVSACSFGKGNIIWRDKETNNREISKWCKYETVEEKNLWTYFEQLLQTERGYTW